MMINCEICRHNTKAISIVSERVVCINCMSKMLLKGLHLRIAGPDNPDDIHVFLKPDRTLGFQRGPNPYKTAPKEPVIPGVPAVVEDTPFDAPIETLGPPDEPDLSKLDKRSKAYKNAAKAKNLQNA
jgi:hypothetical protein